MEFSPSVEVTKLVTMSNHRHTLRAGFPVAVFWSSAKPHQRSLDCVGLTLTAAGDCQRDGTWGVDPSPQENLPKAFHNDTVMEWINNKRFWVSRRVFGPSLLSRTLFELQLDLLQWTFTQYRAQRTLFLAQPVTFYSIKNLFGGAGIFSACNEKYKTALYVPGTENCLTKKLRLIEEELRCTVYYDHFFSLSVLSSHHSITEPERADVFWPLLPHGVLLCGYWPHSKLSPGQQVSDVHATLLTRALRRPQLPSRGFSSCSRSSRSEAISQRLLFPTALLAMSDGSGTSSWSEGFLPGASS